MAIHSPKTNASDASHRLALAPAAELATVDGCPKKQAEAALAAARREGDRQAGAAALSDLGLIASDSPPSQHGAALLKEALKLTRELKNRPLQADILISLGRASLLANAPQMAAPQLQEALAIARELGDRYLEKLALERLGHAYRRLGDGPRCLAAWHEAVALARGVGDRLHEATLYQRGTLNANRTGLVGSATDSQTWSLDALGNWTSVTTNGNPETRTTNAEDELTTQDRIGLT